MRDDNLHEQTTWDAGYRDLRFEPVPRGDQVAEWLERFTRDEDPAGSCLEIGCFPGRYLTIFGDRGFEVNGVDLTPRTEPEMADWLKSRGYRVGVLAKEDFFRWSPGRRFDVVYSNGFVEHFTDWKPVLRRHVELVNPGGLLLVSAPNFRGGLQHRLHGALDRENMDLHYLPSMDPSLWREVLVEDGLEILYTGYFSRFDFWVGVGERSFAAKVAFRLLRALKPVLRWILPKDSEWSSPYCGVVARRKR